jgi:hypothetical protein
MPQISNNNAFSQAWLKIKSVLSSVSDPKGKTKFLYTAFPILLIDKRESYPLITIEPVQISHSALTFTNLKEGPLQAIIEVYASNNVDLDSVSDDVAKTMHAADASFTLSGITNMALVNSSYAHYPREKLHIHNRTFVYEFKYGWF